MKGRREIQKDHTTNYRKKSMHIEGKRKNMGKRKGEGVRKKENETEYLRATDHILLFGYYLLTGEWICLPVAQNLRAALLGHSWSHEHDACCQ